MVTNQFREYVQERTNQLATSILQWVVKVGGSPIKMIEIISNKPIELKGLLVNSNGVCPSLIVGSEAVDSKIKISTLVEGGGYACKWNSDNYYYIQFLYNTPAKIDDVVIQVNQEAGKSDWIYGATVKIINFNDVAQIVNYCDGIRWDDDCESNPALIKLFKNASHRIKAKETFAIYKEIKESFDPLSFLEIEGLLRNILGSFTISPHGYLKNLNGVDKTKLSVGLEYIIKKIQENGNIVFVSSGTLLGAIRTGKFIGHDDDVDFGVLMSGETLNDAIESMVSFETFLSTNGLMRSSVFLSDVSTFHWKLKYIAGVNIDVFPVWSIEGSLYAWPYCFGALNVSDLIPLRLVELEGSFFPAPVNSEKFLEVNYGENWRTPDPTFHFDWRSATKNFSEYLRIVRNIRKERIK